MYDILCILRKKTVHPAHTKINIVRGTVIHNPQIKFELNRMHRSDAIVFTHTPTHTQQKVSGSIT